MVSGSGPWRGVTREQIQEKFDSFYVPLFEKVVAARAQVLVGNADGMDRLIRIWFKSRGYSFVEASGFAQLVPPAPAPAAQAPAQTAPVPEVDLWMQRMSAQEREAYLAVRATPDGDSETLVDAEYGITKQDAWITSSEMLLTYKKYRNVLGPILSSALDENISGSVLEVFEETIKARPEMGSEKVLREKYSGQLDFFGKVDAVPEVDTTQVPPSWMKLSGGIDDKPYLDINGSFSLQPIQDYTPQLKYHIDAPARLLHGEFWRIRNMLSSEVIIGRQYAQRMMSLAGALDGHLSFGFKYEKIGDKYGIFNLDDFTGTGSNFPQVATFDTLGKAIDDVRKRNKKLRRWKIPAEDRELAEDVMRWASAEREGIDVIVSGVEHYALDHEDESLRGKKIVEFIVTNSKTKDSRTFYQKNHAFEFKKDQPDSGDWKITEEYIPVMKNISEVRDKFFEKFGKEEGQKRFDKILVLSEEALQRRSKVNNEMREIAGPNWINHWEAREGDADITSKYIPHVYIYDGDKDPNIRKFAFREESRRVEKRKFENYLDAAKYGGLEPVTTRIDELVENWFKDVWGAAVNRTMVSLGITMMDVDGSPLWIPEFNEDVVDNKYEPRIAMSNAMISQATENLLAYINSVRLRSGMKEYKPNRGRKGRTLINEIINANGDLLKRQGFVHVESGEFKSVKSFLVKNNSGIRGPSGITEQMNVLHSLVSRPSDNAFFKFTMQFNNWSKHLGLGLSMFHPVSLLESLIAVGGIESMNFTTLFHPARYMAQISNARRRAMSDPNLVSKWAEAGMRTDAGNPNYDSNKIFQDLKAVQELGVPGLTQIAKGWELYSKWMTQWMWSEFLPGAKYYSAELLYDELVENFTARGVPFDDFEVRRQVASTVNDAFGGVNWDQYIWANPKRLQMLHLIMFAPDWTISAFNTAGAPNLPIIKDILRQNQGDIQKQLLIQKYWPAMAFVVITGIPQAVQLAIYSAAALMPGPDDEEAKPFLFQNEAGKRGLLESGLGAHIDMTPILKKMGWIPVIGYKGDTTGQRRVYLQFAKQAHEVFAGWATAPVTTFGNKTSAAVRAVFEQATSYNTAGWELGFKDKPLLGLFAGEKGFADSRIAYVGKKFVPMSILSIMDGRPTTFFAPSSRGISNYTAQTKMAELISVYADQDTWKSLKGSEDVPVDLNSLGRDILEAAERNGHDPDLVLAAARRNVLAHYYRQFFFQLNKEDWKGMDKSANAILRINSGSESTIKSMKLRYKESKKELTPEKQATILSVFDKIQNGSGDVKDFDPEADILDR
jgi:hypothetical protein